MVCKKKFHLIIVDKPSIDHIDNYTIVEMMEMIQGIDITA